MSMKCSERIRQVRESRNYSQKDIARELHVSQRVYSDYERGRVRISVEALQRLAFYYDLSMDYLSGSSDVESCYPKN